MADMLGAFTNLMRWLMVFPLLVILAVGVAAVVVALCITSKS